MIILASNSPRRRELLAHITRDFTVQGTDVDESLPAGIAPAAAVEQLSLRKALPLNNGAQIVIGADTVVAVDGIILGKPADEAEARQMLARLSGRWHSVFTGVSLVQGERHLTFSCETRVRFFDLTAAEIDASKFVLFVYFTILKPVLQEFQGDYFNVVGLPVSRLYRALNDFEQK